MATEEAPLAPALVKLDQARQLLAALQNVDEVKAIRDQAEAMRVYARQAGLGLDAQNHAAEIKLRAERRAGELLRDMEKQAPGDYRKRYPADTVPPTLEEVGVTRLQSSRWQAVAAIPEPVFQAHVDGIRARGGELTSRGLQAVGKALGREQRQADLVAAYAAAPESPDARILDGDCLLALADVADGAVDVIITDPPYEASAVYLYGVLAAIAARVLKPGGHCLVMTGQMYLPQVLAQLTTQLTYHWTLAYLTPGAAPEIWARRVMTFWKPVLWLVNGPAAAGGSWVSDVVRSEAQDKAYHAWGQSESGMARLVERFSQPGELVLDPFAGAATTGVVAVQLQRRFLGVEIDAATARVARARLAQAQFS